MEEVVGVVVQNDGVLVGRHIKKERWCTIRCPSILGRDKCGQGQGLMLICLQSRCNYIMKYTTVPIRIRQPGPGTQPKRPDSTARPTLINMLIRNGMKTNRSKKSGPAASTPLVLIRTYK